MDWLKKRKNWASSHVWHFGIAINCVSGSPAKLNNVMFLHWRKNSDEDIVERVYPFSEYQARNEKGKGLQNIAL